MTIQSQNRPIHTCLTNASTFPYTLKQQSYGLSIINQGADMTVTISSGISFVVPQNTTIDDYFDGFITVNATGSTNFKMDIR